jgi:phosphatidylglycerol---prolipoprotein diacylglyceryl transferase
MMLGIAIGAIFWYKRAQGRSDMLLIYLGALIGGFAGAKLAYLLAEGWLEWQSRTACCAGPRASPC